MFCDQCGTELPDNARFCAVCGKHRLVSARPSAWNETSGASASPRQDTSFSDGYDRKIAAVQVAPIRTASWLAAGAAVVVMVGSLGPWAEMQGLVGGSINGTTGDGKLTVVGALAALACSVGVVTVPRGGRGLVMAMLATLLLAACGAVGLFDWYAIETGVHNSTLLNISSRTGIESVGVAWGLMAVTVGGFAGALLSAISGAVMKASPLKDAEDRER